MSKIAGTCRSQDSLEFREKRWIEQIEQIRALSSPVRQELMDSFQANGAATIAEVAADLGRAPETLYYHVSQLTSVGLLREVSKRATNGRPEVLYAVADASTQVRYDSSDPANVDAVNQMARSMLRVAGKDFVEGFVPGMAHTEGPFRNLWASRTKGRVKPEALAEVNRLLHRLTQCLLDGESSDGTLVALTWVLAPISGHKTKRTKSPKNVD